MHLAKGDLRMKRILVAVVVAAVWGGLSVSQAAEAKAK